MTKFILGLVAILASIGAVKWGSGTLFWVGAGVLGFVGLVLFVLLTWGLVKLFRWSITVALYDILTIAIISTLTIKGLIGVNVGIFTIIPLTTLFSLIIMRVIGYHAQTSVIWGEIFSWLTGYKIKNIIMVYKKTSSTKLEKVEDVVAGKEERDNIIASLQYWGFKKKESQEAADYAIEKKPDDILEDKIKCALNHVKSDKVLETME